MLRHACTSDELRSGCSRRLRSNGANMWCRILCSSAPTMLRPRSARTQAIWTPINTGSLTTPPHGDSPAPSARRSFPITVGTTSTTTSTRGSVRRANLHDQGVLLQRNEQPGWTGSTLWDTAAAGQKTESNPAAPLQALRGSVVAQPHCEHQSTRFHPHLLHAALGQQRAVLVAIHHHGATKPAFTVLADREITYTGTTCP